VKRWLAAAAGCGVLIFAAQAREGGEAVAPAAPVAAARAPAAAAPPAADWSEWTRPLNVTPGAHDGRPVAAPRPAEAEPLPVSDEDIDVVDAHWMALTMWGEARGQGEEGMRAVGHVIANRWRPRATARSSPTR
jgi:spore germination cell wall hydrolase CwlJ-like protein